MLMSHDNQKIKIARVLLTKKGRDQHGMFLAEGEILVKEYLTYNDCVEFILVSENAPHHIKEMATDEHYLVKDSVFNTLSNTQNSQGILAIVRKKTFDVADVIRNDLIFYADSIQDPGNMGTIIRSCDAFGAKSIIYNKGSVDIFNPKTIRASMGSLNRLFHIKADSNSEMLKILIENGYTIFSAVVDSNVYLESIKEYKKAVIVIGNESKGIDKEIICRSNINFSIKMNGPIESLNAGVAASICLYHFGMIARH